MKYSPYFSHRQARIHRTVQWFPMLALILFLVALALWILWGCTALDRLSPEFAGHPATTQPSSQPAEGRNVAAQVADVGSHLVTNPAVNAAADSSPYGHLVLDGLGIIFAGFLAYSRSQHKSRADDAEAVITATAPAIAEIGRQVTPAAFPTVQKAIDTASALLDHPAASAAVAKT